MKSFLRSSKCLQWIEDRCWLELWLPQLRLTSLGGGGPEPAVKLGELGLGLELRGHAQLLGPLSGGAASKCGEGGRPLLQRLARPALRHGLESKLELRRCLGLDWRGSGRGWLLRGRGNSDWSGRGPSLDWGGSGLGSDLLRLLGPGRDRDWSAQRLRLANSDGLRRRGRLGLSCSRLSESEGIVIDRAGHRCRAGSGLGLALAKRLENEESVCWLVGDRLGGGPSSGATVSSEPGASSPSLLRGLIHGGVSWGAIRLLSRSAIAVISRSAIAVSS